MADELQQPGVEQEAAAESQTTAEPTEAQGTDDRVEAAFAKRFAAERAKIEQEYAEKYKDYDTYRNITDYFRELNEMNDARELSDRIEMERLQARAEQAQVSPEVQRRLEELEAKSAEADSLREQQSLQNWYQGFRSELEKFAADRKVEADEVEKFMIDNNVKDMEIAYKAMKFQDVEAKREEIEKAAIAKYLGSKKAPNAIGAGSAAHVPATTPKTFQEATRGALEMIRNANRNL